MPGVPSSMRWPSEIPARISTRGTPRIRERSRASRARRRIRAGWSGRTPRTISRTARTSSLLPEQCVERGARRVGLAGRRDVRAGLRLEVIAEVGLRLVAHFLGHGLAAVLRDARVVFDAHAADVQLVAAGLALVEPAQRQRQRLERGTAFPAGEAVAHGPRRYFSPYFLRKYRSVCATSSGASIRS